MHWGKIQYWSSISIWFIQISLAESIFPLQANGQRVPSSGDLGHFQLELFGVEKLWQSLVEKLTPRTEISSPIPKDVTAQMHFWIFHIGHKFKLLTKQWAMRHESWWVVCNNISGEGEWDDSLRSTRVACVQRAQMYYSFNVLYLVPHPSTSYLQVYMSHTYEYTVPSVPSAEAHARHQYATLLLTFERNTNKLCGFTIFLIETLAVRHPSGFYPTCHGNTTTFQPGGGHGDIWWGNFAQIGGKWFKVVACYSLRDQYLAIFVLLTLVTCIFTNMFVLSARMQLGSRFSVTSILSR